MRVRPLLTLALFSVAAAADAAPGSPPWLKPGDVPLPARTRSVEITRSEEPLYLRADAGSPRRGSALKGARLPLYAASRGPGCTGRWLLVGPLAWVCESVVRLSGEPALEPVEPQPLEDGLPHRYYFVGPGGSLGY